MSIERIELRKKYYDGNMVRDAVMSVTDDYNTIMKLLSAFADQPPLTDVIEVVRCGECRHYQGNHDVPGCAPCDFWGIGAVMWDDYCSRAERWNKNGNDKV